MFIWCSEKEMWFIKLLSFSSDSTKSYFGLCMLADDFCFVWCKFLLITWFTFAPVLLQQNYNFILGHILATMCIHRSAFDFGYFFVQLGFHVSVILGKVFLVLFLGFFLKELLMLCLFNFAFWNITWFMFPANH